MRIPIGRAGALMLLLGLFLQPSVGATQEFPPDQEIISLLQSRVDEGRAVGIVLGLVVADGSTRIVAVGDAGLNARPLGPRSVFELGSITKVFTATLLADMVARGEVSLSDPVADYLPDGVTIPSRGGREITLLDLSTQHSTWYRTPARPSSLSSQLNLEQPKHRGPRRDIPTPLLKLL